MSHTLYATFARPEDAEKAAGALIDQGVRPEDLSVVRQPEEGFSEATAPRSVATNVVGPVAEDEEPMSDEDHDRKVAAEASASAVKGSMIGAGIGALAVLAALVVPGVGFILGAGALASAIGGVVATAGVGAAAGAIVAYLKDMGVEEHVAREYGEAVQSGGAILAITVPSGAVEAERASAVLAKYGATNVNQYAARGGYVA